MSVGGVGQEQMEALDLGQGLSIAGSFEESVEFGGGIEVSAGSDDGFVAHYLTSATAAPSLSSPLLEAIPNPFNPATTIHFAIPRSGPVTLELFDARGRRMRTLLDSVVSPLGRHRFELSARGFASGVYFLRLTHALGEVHRRIVLLK